MEGELTMKEIIIMRIGMAQLAVFGENWGKTLNSRISRVILRLLGGILVL